MRCTIKIVTNYQMNITYQINHFLPNWPNIVSEPRNVDLTNLLCSRFLRVK